MTKVFVRPRPLAVSEQGETLVHYEFASNEVSVLTSDTTKRFKPFTGVLSSTNAEAFTQSVRPLVADMLSGATACCFAYGHTNSGKTHTIFGYTPEKGMYHYAIEELFEQLPSGLLVQVRFFELYNGKIHDLLNDRRPGFVREDGDGTIHVRSETTIGVNGETLTQSLRAIYCDSAVAVIDAIKAGAGARAQGTSELHNQSSRSHAVLELEIVTPELARARESLILAQSQLVPVGKARDDLFIAIQSKLYKQGDDGKYTVIGEASEEDTKRLAEQNALVHVAEQVVRGAEAQVAEIVSKSQASVGGMLVFVDLAGAEYTGEGLQRNSRELREAKEINTSLLALKECIRAQTAGGHVPYRNSKLTMLLRGHLNPTNAPSTVMIATVSSAAGQLTKALNTIKYAALVGDAFQK